MRLRPSALLAVLLLLAAQPARAQWESLPLPITPGAGAVRVIAEIGGSLYVGTSAGLFRSPDDGQTWTALTLGLPIRASIVDLVATPSYLVLAVNGVGVYRSQNGGRWERADNGLGADAAVVETLHSAPSGLYVGTGDSTIDSEGIYYSDSDGALWAVRNAGIPGGGPSRRRRRVLAIESMGAAVVLSITANLGEVNATYRSEDRAQTWARIVGFGAPEALATDGQALYAGFALGPVQRSTDGGATWAQRAALPAGGFEDLHARGPELWAAPTSGAPHRSLDGAGSWTPLTDGLPPNPRVERVHVGARYVFAGTAAIGLWRRPRFGTTAAEPGSVAKGVSLTATPNPARGAATVALTLAEAQPVTVAVLDALGRRVALLHDGVLAAGTHELRLDAAGLPAGVYVVRATAGAVVVARRLTVVR